MDKKPKHIRCFDNGGATLDRYTIVNTKPKYSLFQRIFCYGECSHNPYHPQGVGCIQHMEYHLMRCITKQNKPIRWNKLPEDVRKFALEVAE